MQMNWLLSSLKSLFGISPARELKDYERENSMGVPEEKLLFSAKKIIWSIYS